MRAPGWACDLVDGVEVDAKHVTLHAGFVGALSSRCRPGWRLLTLVARLPDDLGRDGIRPVARAMYDALGAALLGEPTLAPVRFWNFIPEIHRPDVQGLDRYRAFNIGRHEAMVRYFGSETAFVLRVPTATGVGHDGDELVIHALASDRAQVSIENPRQRPAYRYSRHFGPIPPSFARATIVCDGQAGSRLIVGGTSSVRGEESMFAQDAGAQVEESIANLRSLVASACEIGADASSLDSDDSMRWFTSIRAYHVRPADREVIVDRLEGTIDPETTVEFLRADICRPELLVEIEGVATLPRLFVCEPSTASTAESSG